MTQSPIPLSRFDLPRPPRRAARRVAVAPLVKADATHPAASSVVERYSYDGFGHELTGSTSLLTSPLNPFRFSTKQVDAETGMNYYGYRFYATDAGRWINRDPIAESGGVNIYGMVGNDAILYCDINGMYSFWEGVADVANAGVVAATVVRDTAAATGVVVGAAILAPEIAVGVGVSAAVGGGLGGAQGYLTTGTVQGTVNGYGSGVIGGAVGGVAGAATLAGTGNVMAAGGAGAATSSAIGQAYNGNNPALGQTGAAALSGAATAGLTSMLPGQTASEVAQNIASGVGTTAAEVVAQAAASAESAGTALVNQRVNDISKAGKGCK